MTAATTTDAGLEPGAESVSVQAVPACALCGSGATRTWAAGCSVTAAEAFAACRVPYKRLIWVYDAGGADELDELEEGYVAAVCASLQLRAYCRTCSRPSRGDSLCGMYLTSSAIRAANPSSSPLFMQAIPRWAISRFSCDIARPVSRYRFSSGAIVGAGPGRATAFTRKR